MPARFAALFLLLALHKSDNSLLSRFRNPYEFTAPVEPDPDEMDPNMYENLLEELSGELSPEGGKPEGRPLLPYLKKDFHQNDEYDFMMNSADYDNSTFDARISNARTVWNASDFARAMGTLPPDASATNSSDARRYNPHAHWTHRDHWNYWRGKLKATCYVCNIHTNNDIPNNPMCHDAFNSRDGRATTLARYFRGHCYKKWHWDSRIETKTKYQAHYKDGRGLYRGYYGAYIGGCFKRFLDVGQVYTSRGCRSMPPRKGGGYADHRYRKLEYLLKGEKNACVMSSHASLTPFSRSISLYVRYHVCVCEGKFCNEASPMHITYGLLSLFIIHLFL